MSRAHEVIATGAARALQPWAAVAVALLSAAACADNPGSELGDQLCTDLRDDDGDSLADCDDPDCYAVEACRSLRGSVDHTGRSDAGSTPPPPQIIDKNPVGPSDASEPDGGTDLQPPATDSGVAACGECLPEEACIDNRCQPVAVDGAGHFLLQVLSATVPDLSVDSLCYDQANECTGPLPSPPFGFCTCPTDPYVRVVRVRAGSETVVGTTATVIDQDMPTFPATVFDLRFQPGDVLVFKVIDADEPPETDDPLFDCKPDLRNLQPGPIQCSALGGLLGVQTYEVKAQLLAP